VVWTISNLCRGKPAPDFETIKPALSILSQVLMSNDIETIQDACWTLSYVSDGPNERIQAVLDTGIGPRIVELLCSRTTGIQTPALRVVGNVVTGDDAQTQYMIDLNIVPALLWILDSPSRNIRKEACWTLSNISAGTSAQIQVLIVHQVFPKLIELLRSSEFDIQKEAAWAISNATSGGSTEQILYLVQQGALPPMCSLLSIEDVKILTVALEGIENILRVAQKTDNLDRIIEIISDCGGLNSIEELQHHVNEKIYDRAVKMLEDYFGIEEDGEEFINEIAPQIVNNVNNSGAQYNFGQASSVNISSGFSF
jgi:hypothetical protein